MIDGYFELLTIVETMARDKGISKEEVIDALEQALVKVARGKYGIEYNIRVSVDGKTGAISAIRLMEVVEDVVDRYTQISLEDAIKKDPSLEIGAFVHEVLPDLNLNRVDAQTAKQVVYQLVHSAERLSQYNQFKERVGDIISGIVKRVDFGNIVIELGKAEGLLRRDELIPRENFRVGDRVRACVHDVRSEVKGPQIFLSRASGEFMKKLFFQEVPEIYDGLIVIHGAARDPGSRAKIAVHTVDTSIDPVGSCVGVRGSRVQAVVQELQGEKIDIVLWSSDLATFVVNALAPAEISKVLFGEDAGRLEVVVPDDQLSLAIGRRGQNVRLACQLTGVSIDLLTETQEAERKALDIQEKTLVFTKHLDIDDEMAHVLIEEGFETLEEICYASENDLTTIDGLTTEIALELQKRAKKYLDQHARDMKESYDSLGGDPDLYSLMPDVLVPALLVDLAKKNIKTRKDLADLSRDELQELVRPDFSLTQLQADRVILAARAPWIDQED